jgi:hypothetical protein
MSARTPAWVLACALLAAAPALQARSSPSLSKILPRGAQRGTEIDVVLSGAQLKDARELLLYKPGIEVLKMAAENDTTLKASLRIAPDAALGEHPLRVRTSTGISDLRTFHVGPFPSVDEKEPNNNFAEPQKIALDVTVVGVVTNEDVDYYAVDLRKGQRLTAEIEGLRLGNTLFDPYVAILNAKRFELDSSDDTALLLQDSVASIVAPEDGTFIVMVRETSYGGSGDAHYRLHVGTFPRPLMVYPAGGPPGAELQAVFLGDVAGPLPQKLTLPAAAGDKVAVWCSQEGRTPPSPNWVRVSPFPNVLEVEPNDAREKATVVDAPLPVALNGVIERNGDEDWFRFKARKGESYEIRVYARSLRSPLDPTIALFAAGGAQVAANDDQGGLDAAVRFSASADAEYEVRIRDHLRKGGPAYVYRVEFGGTVASVNTHIPAYDREPRDQTRQWIVVPRGNRFATWMRVNRVNASGPFRLDFEGLPAGVTAVSEPVSPEVDRAVVVFEAAPDAPLAGTLAQAIARHTDPASKLEGGYLHSSNLVYGPPNNTIYYASRIDRLAAAVAEEAPYKLRLVEPKVPLVQNGVMTVKVVAERKEGFTKPIELRWLWAPPGIGVPATQTIPEGQSEFAYPLNANGNAPAKAWKVAVLGSADAGHGAVYCSTQLATLTVEAPFVGLKIPMSSVELGKAVEVKCALQTLRPFEGKARVALHGLPPNVTVEPAEREITRDDPEVAFTLKTAATSPPGQHKSLFAQIVILQNGEPIAHNVGGGGILRIDPPPGAASKAKDGKAGK